MRQTGRTPELAAEAARQIRVLVVTSLYLSGHGNFVAEQVRSLRAANIDVEVIFLDPRESRFNYGRSLPRIVRAIGLGKYDIVHTHHTYTTVLVDVAKRLAGSRVSVVLTNHEPEILDRKGEMRTWHPTSRLRHSMRLKRYAARRADYVIFVSRRLADTLAIETAYDVIPCGIDLSKFRPLDQRESRRRLGLPSDDTLIFFPPHPKNKRKRYALARQAFEIVRQRLSNARMVTGGTIQEDVMPLYYSAADVMLQTSSFEASPTVVKEALACEVPIVSTDAGDTRELTQNVPYCWVCDDDPGEIAGRIVGAVGHRAVGGRDRLVQVELGLDQVAARVIQVYQRVLNT